MPPTSINGLPAHVLLVHAVVVLVPLAALLLLASAWWPAARRKLGLVTPLVALIALVFVPVTTHAGEWLRARVPATPLINRHAEMGDGLLPWALAMFLLAAALWYVHAGSRLPGKWGEGARRLRALSRRPAASSRAPIRADRAGTAPSAAGAGAAAVSTARPRADVATVVVGVLATALAAGSVLQVVRIGDSGAKAVWTGNVATHPHPVPGGD